MPLGAADDDAAVVTSPAISTASIACSSALLWLPAAAGHAPTLLRSCFSCHCCRHSMRGRLGNTAACTWLKRQDCCIALLLRAGSNGAAPMIAAAAAAAAASAGAAASQALLGAADSAPSNLIDTA
jgi:hypothetical protein